DLDVAPDRFALAPIPELLNFTTIGWSEAPQAHGLLDACCRQVFGHVAPWDRLLYAAFHDEGCALTDRGIDEVEGLRSSASSLGPTSGPLCSSPPQARPDAGDLGELAGAFSVTRPGLKRADVMWRALSKAAVLDAARRADPAFSRTSDCSCGARSSGASDVVV